MRIVQISGMSCVQLQRLSNAYVDNQLLIETNLQVLAHVAKCGDCGALLEEVERLKRQLQRAVRASGIPEGMQRRLRERLYRG